MNSLKFYSSQFPLRLFNRCYSQIPPVLENPYKAEEFLRILISLYLPSEVLEPVSKDLKQFGKRIIDEIELYGQQAELYPPKLVQYSAWGERIDEVRTCTAWKQLKNVSAEEGLVSLPYERKFGEYSRIHQAAKLHLFSPSSGLYNCPIAMSDGAAKLIQAENISSLMNTAFLSLTSRNPKKFWTSGQWMTERMGGSDVSETTQTIAIQQNNGYFKLYGQKWFTSAIDSEMAFTLARIQHNDGSKDSHLSLFYLETRCNDGTYNQIQIDRLKCKLGTRQLPTAELTLNGCVAQLIGRSKEGVKQISHMLTVTRLHNSLAATGAMRRIVQLACDYSKKRKTFGKSLFKHPLYARTLSFLELRTINATAFALDVSRLMGLVENGLASVNNTILLRILTPLLKLYTGKEAIHVISESLECFGAQGYVEDSGLPRLLRDAQVLPIWEGTTNIQCLDILRVHASTDGECFSIFSDIIKQRIRKASTAGFEIGSLAGKLSSDLALFTMFMEQVFTDLVLFETASRDIAFRMCELYIASLFLDYASNNHTHRIMIYIAEQNANHMYQRLGGICEYGESARKGSLHFLFSKDKK